MAITLQEYYDLLVKTSAEGGFPAMHISGCRYRTGDGRKCAFGLLIPDDKYTTSMENKNCSVVLANWPFLQECVPEGLTIRNLREIQFVHDGMAYDAIWSHTKFVKRLNLLPVFNNVEKSNV